jgi:hypothetical protein
MLEGQSMSRLQVGLCMGVLQFVLHHNYSSKSYDFVGPRINH